MLDEARFAMYVSYVDPPSGPIGVPAYVSDARGYPHPLLATLYRWLVSIDCDEASILGVFCLMQFNPAAYNEVMLIASMVRDAIISERGLGDASKYVTSLTEIARRTLYPDGNKWAGNPGTDVEHNMF